MSTFEVSTEDLAAAGQRLGAQAQLLGTVLAQVTAACSEVERTILSSLEATQISVQRAHDEVLGTLATTRASADEAQWTGPDADQFRADTVTLTELVAAVSTRMRENFAEHRTAAQQLQSDLEARQAVFVQGITRDQESTADLQRATQTEQESYQRTFAGGFGADGSGSGGATLAVATAAVSMLAFAGPGSTDSKVNALEQQLRAAGLLSGPPASGRYRQWLENAVRRGVPAEEILKIAAENHITPEDFAVLDGAEEIREDADGDGIAKSFFLLPTDISGEDAAKAVRMTYLLNAGTDYGAHGQARDFTPTPYGSDELRRITERQQQNSWSYSQDVAFVHRNGGRLVTTPNGMMMGLGGNGLQDLYSQQGGTTWGDIFMLNIDDPADPAQQLRQVVSSGRAWYETDRGVVEGSLDLDRLLHHEERHSQQWGREGYGGFAVSYPFDPDGYEREAGLSDGGY